MSVTTTKPDVGTFGFYFPTGPNRMESPKHGQPCKVTEHIQLGVMVVFKDTKLGTDFAGEGQFHPDTSAAW